MPPDLAFNTALSFISNTNWQAYGGEGAGLIVGLEAAPMPGDFVVERGEYRGQRVQ